MHGYGCGGGDGGGREHEDVGCVGEHVGEDYEGHGGVDYAGEDAGWVEEFAGYVVCLWEGLVSFLSVWTWLEVRGTDGSGV